MVVVVGRGGGGGGRSVCQVHLSVTVVVPAAAMVRSGKHSKHVLQ